MGLHHSTLKLPTCDILERMATGARTVEVADQNQAEEPAAVANVNPLNQLTRVQGQQPLHAEQDQEQPVIGVPYR
jgi:hypothetical protein